MKGLLIFQAEHEDSTDDEETIAKEEEIARQEEGAQESETAEVAALCAEADASIDDLLPPGYLEHLQQLHEKGDAAEEVQGSSSSPPSIASQPASPVSANF